jgi:hypothetical protein
MKWSPLEKHGHRVGADLTSRYRRITERNRRSQWGVTILLLSACAACGGGGEATGDAGDESGAAKDGSATKEDAKNGGDAEHSRDVAGKGDSTDDGPATDAQVAKDSGDGESRDGDSTSPLAV